MDFPIKNGGSFHGKLLIHQRVTNKIGLWMASVQFARFHTHWPHPVSSPGRSTVDSILSYFEISPNGQDWTRFKRAWLWYRPSGNVTIEAGELRGKFAYALSSLSGAKFKEIDMTRFEIQRCRLYPLVN